MAGAIERLRKAILRTRPGMLRQSIIIWHDNARSHTANLDEWLVYGTTAGWATDQHPYNPNFAPIVFSLFGHLKNNMAGKRSARDADMKQAVTSWQQTLNTNTSLVATVGQIFKWQWLLGGGLVYTICYRVFLLRFSSIPLYQWFFNGVPWQCCVPWDFASCAPRLCIGEWLCKTQHVN